MAEGACKERCCCAPDIAGLCHVSYTLVQDGAYVMGCFVAACHAARSAASLVHEFSANCASSLGAGHSSVRRWLQRHMVAVNLGQSPCSYLATLWLGTPQLTITPLAVQAIIMLRDRSCSCTSTMIMVQKGAGSL